MCAGRASSSRSRIRPTAPASASRCRAGNSTGYGSSLPTATASTPTAGPSSTRREASSGCPGAVVSAVGHEQDTPLCDLAADVRASTPTAAARLVVPDLGELRERLDHARAGLGRGARRSLDVHAQRLAHAHERLRRAPALLVERRASALEQAAGRLRALSPKATLNRGYAIVRAGEAIVRSAATVESGVPIDIEVSDGRFGARVD